MSQDEKTIALVTGVGRKEGIGFEICRQLAQKGFTVLVTARTLEKAENAAKELNSEGLEVHPYKLNVLKDDSVSQLATTIEKDFGRLDVLINNAAGYVDWSEKTSTADLKASMELLETNLFGGWRTTQILLPLLHKSKHPRIVNVSSGAGSHDDPGFGLKTNHGAVASYGISKAALNALTAKFAAELEDTNILVNSVCPGLTATAPGMEAMGARPVPEGAASIIWAALIPDDGPRGGFFRDGKPLPW